MMKIQSSRVRGTTNGEVALLVRLTFRLIVATEDRDDRGRRGNAKDNWQDI